MSTIEDAFPQQIKVRGLPFMLQGWNKKYYKTGRMSDGKPVYRLDSYVLYWSIPIIGVEIKRVNGIWVLQRDCDSNPILEINKYGGQEDPFGYWSQGMRVEPV